MVIGITGDQEKEKLRKIFSDNYSFKFIDVDEIFSDTLKNILKGNDDIKYNWKGNNLLILKLRNEVDARINSIINSIQEKETIVLDYSMLEDSYIIEQCDLLIKMNFNNKKVATNDIELLKKYRSGIISSKYKSSKFHLEIGCDDNWESKIKEYIDYNLYNDTKITVVVPVYNTSDYLTKCINSITNQTYRNLEIILIDDGSTDESLELCKLLAERDSRIKVIHQDNKGLAETRNKGMELATGEYICFIDSDDYIENTMLEKLLKAIKQTNADVCEGSFYIHMKDGNIKDVSCEQKGVRFVDGKLNLINAYSDATILIPAPLVALLHIEPVHVLKGDDGSMDALFQVRVTQVRPLGSKLGVRLQQGHKVIRKGSVPSAGLGAHKTVRRDLHQPQRLLRHDIHALEHIVQNSQIGRLAAGYAGTIGALPCAQCTFIIFQHKNSFFL